MERRAERAARKAAERQAAEAEQRLRREREEAQKAEEARAAKEAEDLRLALELSARTAAEETARRAAAAQAVAEEARERVLAERRQQVEATRRAAAKEETLEQANAQFEAMQLQAMNEAAPPSKHHLRSGSASMTAPVSAVAVGGSSVNYGVDLPEELMCPISHELMRDPVFTADGMTYEREAIETWLQDHNTSPLTGEVLEDKKVTPALMVKGMCRKLREKNPTLC